MTETLTKAAIIAAALAAGTLALWPADELPCDPGAILMQTVAVHDGDACTIETVALTCGDDGQPKDTAFTVGPESKLIDCASIEWTADVMPYPLEQRYPSCLVGEVERLATEDTPALPPYVGTCCQPGCVAAGTVEHIAPGGPKFYECDRLHRLFPDAPCGEP